MKAYKGFNKDMTCRGFKFKEGETYHEDKARLCESGFHACEDPLDCFFYYNPNESVYHEVELDDVSAERNNDTKVVANTIKIGGEIGFLGIAKSHVEYVLSQIKDGNKKSAHHKEENRSAATNTGNRSAATNTGNWSAATVSGKDSVAIATGYKSKVCGGVGCAIVCVERGDWNGITYPIKAICSAIVDGEQIKPDVWYTVKDGKFIETED